MTTKQQAFELFFQSDLTQVQIAEILSIDRKTLYTWIREGDWKRARKVARQAPSLLVEQYYTQLVNINDHIAAREEAPFPTKDEAAVIHRLTMTISRIRTGPGPGEIMEIFADFTKHVLTSRDLDHAQNVIGLLDAYVRDMLKQNSSGFGKRHSFHLATNDDPEDIPDEPGAASGSSDPVVTQPYTPGSMLGHAEPSSDCQIIELSNSENEAQMGNSVPASTTETDCKEGDSKLKINDKEAVLTSQEAVEKNEKNGEENGVQEEENTSPTPATGNKEIDASPDQQPPAPDPNNTPVPYSKYRRERKPAGFKRYSYSRTVYMRPPPPGYFP